MKKYLLITLLVTVLISNVSSSAIFQVDLTGSGENSAATGDLDITEAVSIGAFAASIEDPKLTSIKVVDANNWHHPSAPGPGIRL